MISQIETDKSTPSVSTLYAITTALGISIEDLFGVDREATPSDLGGVDLEDLALPLSAIVPRIGRGGANGPPAGGRGAGAATAEAATSALPAALQHAGAADARVHGRSEAAQRRIGPIVRADAREVLTLDSGVTWELLGRLPHKHVDFLLITYQPGGSSSSSGLLMRHPGTEFGFVISGELTLALGFETHRLVAGDSVSFDSSTPHGYRNESTAPAVGVWFVLERPT
jgi:quercetin dioxygenase-like cupin family protein